MDDVGLQAVAVARCGERRSRIQTSPYSGGPATRATRRWPSDGDVVDGGVHRRRCRRSRRRAGRRPAPDRRPAPRVVRACGARESADRRRGDRPRSLRRRGVPRPTSGTSRARRPGWSPPEGPARTTARRARTPHLPRSPCRTALQSVSCADRASTRPKVSLRAADSCRAARFGTHSSSSATLKHPRTGSLGDSGLVVQRVGHRAFGDAGPSCNLLDGDSGHNELLTGGRTADGRSGILQCARLSTPCHQAGAESDPFGRISELAGSGRERPRCERTWGWRMVVAP